MIEGGDDLQRLRQEHAVAEHVARHVAATDDADHVLLHVDAAFGEVALHRDPGAARRDAHRLVIIALAAAAGEGITQPEAAFERDRIGDVTERSGALVRSDDEIGILAVVDAHAIRMDDLAGDDVVGDRQERADEDAVAFRPFREPGLAIRGGIGQLLGVEAALRAGRHDDRVLHPLRLHQAEDLGAEVVAPVRPAQAAARDRAGAQVDALDARAVHPHLAPWQRGGKAGDAAGIELERQRFLAGGGEGVGAQGSVDDGLEGAQDPIVIDCDDRIEPGGDGGIDRIGIAAGLGIMRKGEAIDQCLGEHRCAAQRIDHGAKAV